MTKAQQIRVRAERLGFVGYQWGGIWKREGGIFVELVMLERLIGAYEEALGALLARRPPADTAAEVTP
jgi:hypothetical protein